MLAQIRTSLPLCARTAGPSTSNAAAGRDPVPGGELSSRDVASVSASASVRSRAITIAKWAAMGAAYGALVGSGTALAYTVAGIGNGTLIHMGIIAAGGAIGAPVLGAQLKPRAEPPANYALGALCGAGLTWATSGFGILQNPVLGAAIGGVLGGFYGALAGAFVSS